MAPAVFPRRPFTVRPHALRTARPLLCTSLSWRRRADRPAGPDHRPGPTLRARRLLHRVFARMCRAYLLVHQPWRRCRTHDLDPPRGRRVGTYRRWWRMLDDDGSRRQVRWVGVGVTHVPVAFIAVDSAAAEHESGKAKQGNLRAHDATPNGRGTGLSKHLPSTSAGVLPALYAALTPAQAPCPLLPKRAPSPIQRHKKCRRKAGIFPSPLERTQDAGFMVQFGRSSRLLR
jgi:hypothetical protein